MEHKLENPTFERWLAYLFDHPVQEPAWYFALNAEYYDPAADPPRTVEYITRLFAAPVEHTKGCTDAQINQGLWMLIDSGYGQMQQLVDERVDPDKCAAAVRAMYTVFEQLFAPRCSPHLEHLLRGDEEVPGLNPLNRVCYMWWDLMPLYGGSEDAQQKLLAPHCIEVMERTLYLPALACRESALHGLGHWHFAHPQRVEGIIDSFLAREADIGLELRAYALQARQGCVL